MYRSNGLRNRNKFPCNFCPKFVCAYVRHVSTCHAQKKKVATILKMPKEQQSKYFGLLRTEAIRQYNAQILDSGNGELIVGRRSQLKSEVEDYLPCPECLTLWSAKQLWRHYRTCKSPERNVNLVRKRRTVVRQQARLLMDVNLMSKEENLDFTMNVLGTLRNDDVSNCVKKDSLICMFGQSLYKRLGLYRATEIAQRMRLLGRFLLAANGHKSSNLTLSDFISGKRFDDVLKGVESLCCTNTDATGRNVFMKPSLGTKLGHSLLKCARLKKREAIKTGNKKAEANADRFIALHASDWIDCISSRALMTLKLKRLEGPEELPKSEDLVKLKDHIDAAINRFVAQLKNRFSFTVYRNLLEYILAALILFNKRRGGEASKLLFSAYVNRRSWSHSSNQEIVDSLTDVEKKLVQRIDLVHIPGKKTRVVPMLILPSIRDAMDLIVEVRRKNHLALKNKYFFASESDDGHLSHYKVLRRVATESGLVHPELIGSTKLRKYLATLAQIVNLTSGEQDWLSNHLGHEIHIDKDFYRANDAILEISKISRLLMVAHGGQMSKYAGKTLTEIGVEGNYISGNEEEPDSRPEDGLCVSDENLEEPEENERKVGHDTQIEELDDEGDDLFTSIKLRTPRSVEKKTKKQRKLAMYGKENDMTEDEEDNLVSSENLKFSEGNVKRAMKRRNIALHAQEDGGSEDDRDDSMLSRNSRNLGSVGKRNKERRLVNDDEVEGAFTDVVNVGSSASQTIESKHYRRQMGKRVKWSAEELQLLKKELSKFFVTKKAPDEESIRVAMNRHAILRRRSVAQIKSRAFYLIQTGR